MFSLRAYAIVKNKDLKLGVSVRAVFQISLHRKDEMLLSQIRDFFGVGTVTIRSDGAVVYQVSSLKDLQVILKHLDDYPLITDKFADIELFKQVTELMLKQEHLTLEGLGKIVNIKASMNFGTLPEIVLTLFPTIKPVERPVRTTLNIYHPN